MVLVDNQRKVSWMLLVLLMFSGGVCWTRIVDERTCSRGCRSHLLLIVAELGEHFLETWSHMCESSWQLHECLAERGPQTNLTGVDNPAEDTSDYGCKFFVDFEELGP